MHPDFSVANGQFEVTVRVDLLAVRFCARDCIEVKRARVAIVFIAVEEISNHEFRVVEAALFIAGDGRLSPEIAHHFGRAHTEPRIRNLESCIAHSAAPLRAAAGPVAFPTRLLLREGSAILRCKRIIGCRDACTERGKFLLRPLNFFLCAFNFAIPFHERLIRALRFFLVFEVLALDTRLIRNRLCRALTPGVAVREVIKNLHGLFKVLRFFVTLRQHQLRVVT